MNKKIIAALLAFLLAFSGIIVPMDAYAVQKFENNGKSQRQEHTEFKNDLSVRGTNSFGNLLAGELSQEAEEQQQHLGCNIFSIEVTDRRADVTFETAIDAALVVAIYEEDGIKMLDSAKVDVSAGETQAAVSFGLEEMPGYFYLRGYLVEHDNLQPLCISYDSPMYTQEMQEFLAKTTEDFDADRVLNLDEDTENNFAVYSEETIQIPESENENQVVTADDGNNTYVIEDANEYISALKKDDVFAYEYGEGEVLIIKVESIHMEGTTATITGAETSMEEVFEYVKIDGEAGPEDAQVDDSSCEEGVTYAGLVDDTEESGIETRAQRLGGSKEKSFKHEFDKKFSIGGGSVTISGGAELKLNFSAQIYILHSEKYIELKMDYTAQIRAAVDGKIQKEISLARVSFLFYGIEAELTPNLIVDASANISLKGTLKGTVGFRATLKGMKNITSTPKFTTEFKAEGKIYIGLSLVPRISILNKSLASASLTAKVGAQVDAALSQDKGTAARIHTCKNCIKGAIYAKYSLTAEARILLIKSPTLQLLDKTHKISDFYYSLDHNKFAFTLCPHYRYQITVVVLDEDGKKIANAQVKSPFEVNGTQPGSAVTDAGNLVSTDHITTGADGRAIGYLSAGKHTLQISSSGYETAKKKITVPQNKKEIIVRLKKEPEVVVPPVGPGGFGKVKEVKTTGYHTFALMEDGGLYMWGMDYSEDAKGVMHPTPVKIMDRVVKLETYSTWDDHDDDKYYESIAFIQDDGSLYTFGINRSGELGNGTGESSWIPSKVLDNVESVNLGSVGIPSHAITKDGSLYTWGCNESGALGNGTKEDSLSPAKVLDDVILTEVYYKSYAITKDGSLYTWGHNESGALGNGTKEDSLVPVKILGNVLSVELGSAETPSYAITKDGSLYTWGDNRWGTLGNGTGEDSLVPVKILDNVESASIRGRGQAVTKDGSFYTWGNSNTGGFLGNGSIFGSLSPLKILDNVLTVDGNSAITKDGGLHIWGYDSTSEMTEDSLSPMKVLDNVISAEVSYSSYAITKDGSLYTWGDNTYGELGNGTKEDVLVPMKILDDIESTYIGGIFNSYAIAKNGSLYAWGRNNSNGELGNGTTEESLIPVKILDNVKSVWIGNNSNSHAITKKGELYIWGGGSFEGNVECKLTPMKILDNVELADIGSTLYGISYVISTDGSLYMWGNNQYGQLGNGTIENSLTPVKVNFSGTDAASILTHEDAQKNIISTFDLPEPASSGKIFSEEGVDDSQSGEPEDSNASCSWFDLPPNEIYNFYVVKRQDAEDVLDADNLLYIWQASTDETGKMQILYNNNDVQSLSTAQSFIAGLKKTDISAATINVPSLKYDGTEQFVTPQITYRGETLAEGVDYELTDGYSAMDSGTHTVTVSGIGLYTGVLSADYQVVCNHSYRDNRMLVKAAIGRNGTLEQKCSVCGATKKLSVPAVKTAKLSATEYTYNGMIRRPTVTVTDSSGKPLKNDTDYMVSYAANGKNVGIHTVTIMLKGRYSGTIKKTFTVKPKGTSITKLTPGKKKFTIKWKKQKSQVTGYELQYSTSSKFKKAKTVKNIRAKTTSKKIVKLKAKKKYYVRIRTYKTVKLNGISVKLYSRWSKGKSVKTKK